MKLMPGNKKNRAARPRVICLMQTSVDARIIIDRWPDPDAAEGEFESMHERLHGDAWLCGRVVMAYFARTQKRPKRSPASLPRVASREDFITGRAKTYAVGVDAAGKLSWRSNDVNGDRLIMLLSHRAPLAKLAHLRSRGISYLITGRGGQIDFREALIKLRRHFGIKRLLLEGGGKINASFLHAGLIDELELLFTPVIDGDSATTGLFQTDPGQAGLRSRNLRLLGLKRLPRGVLALRYRLDNR
jgi:riboflavin biosynthesis pyrimidine reductase